MLFYNAFIRYLIKSNLILTHNNFYFLVFFISFKTISAAVSSLVNLQILVIVIRWPIMMLWFLIENQNNLDNQEFKTKYISMYEGLKINSWKCLTYNSVFCIRRFLIALAFITYAKIQYNLVYLIFLF